ncbi:MAG: hypothetical protein U5L09_08335 [Bacteroidales bacterium]|nr:hypothetical protein [Bacteroidales bacterium]
MFRFASLYLNKKTAMKLKILILLALSGIFAESAAQSGKIKGRVYDASNNEPLPFSNLVIYGTQTAPHQTLTENFPLRVLSPAL